MFAVDRRLDADNFRSYFQIACNNQRAAGKEPGGVAASSADETMLTILLIGFLLLLGISLMVLDAAIEHVAEGYEDELGFHQAPREWSPEPTSAESGVTLWDQMEGACCPLDMRPTFRPVESTPFERRQH